MLTRKTADIENAFTHFFLHYSGSKKFAIKNSPVINVDSTVYQEEPRDMPEYPVENKKDSDSEDYIENLLKEIRDQDNYNEEPSKEITRSDKREFFTHGERSHPRNKIFSFAAVRSLLLSLLSDKTGNSLSHVREAEKKRDPN